MKKISDVIPFVPVQSPENPVPALSKRQRQIIDLSGAIAEQTREEANELGFMSRLLLMVNLPYRDPGNDKKTWWRKNGTVSIDINSGTKEGKSIGLPYGAYPRLILAYLATQAVKTQSPTIYLGKSFNHFLVMMNINTGGTTRKRLKEQLMRTLSASFSWTCDTEKQWSRINANVAAGAQLWWEVQDADEGYNDWESFVRLNKDFYDEVIKNAVPLDLRVLSVLKNAPLGLDLYMFILWRIYKLKKPVYISWDSLQQQLGGQYADVKEFARHCRSHIKRIKVIHPNLNISFVKGRLCLSV